MKTKETSCLPYGSADIVPDKRQDVVDQVKNVWTLVDSMTSGRAWFIGRAISTLLDRGEKGVFEEFEELLGLKRRSLQQYRRIYLAVPDFKDLDDMVRSGVTYADLKKLVRVPDIAVSTYVDKLTTGEDTDIVLANIDQEISKDLEKRKTDKRIKPKEAPEKGDKPAPAKVQANGIPGQINQESMSSLLKNDAESTRVFKAFKLSIDGAVRAAEAHNNNLVILLEKVLDTERTDDSAYQECWNIARQLEEPVTALIETLTAILDKLRTIPDPGKTEIV